MLSHSFFFQQPDQGKNLDQDLDLDLGPDQNQDQYQDQYQDTDQHLDLDLNQHLDCGKSLLFRFIIISTNSTH